MNIKTKYKIGDKVFGIEETETHVKDGEKCDICKGKGRVPLGSGRKQFPCPACGGRGHEKPETRTIWAVDPVSEKIIGMEVYLYGCRKPQINYEATLNDFEESSNYFFSTKTLAQKECNRRNKKKGRRKN